MPAVNFNTTLLRLIKDVNDIRSALRRVAVNLPLFDISNENTPSQITYDQDNYTPGNYDVLRMSALTNLNISGFRGGVKGRSLKIVNIGPGRLSFTNQDTSSDAENRIVIPYDNIITLLPDASINFYYDISTERWTVSSLPFVEGLFGKSALIRNSTTIIAAIPTGVDTKVPLDTVISDDWDYWDEANNRFLVPEGEDGLYLVMTSLLWDTSPDAGTLRQIRIMRDDFYNIGSIGVPSILGLATNMFVCCVTRLIEGASVHVEVRQDTGSDLDILQHNNIDTRPTFVFSKLQ